MLHYVIWNEIRNYKNAPPLAAIAQAENMQGVQVHLKVGEEAVEDIEHLIAAPLYDPEVGGLVVWTKNHRTYQLIVRQLTQPGCVWLT